MLSKSYQAIKYIYQSYVDAQPHIPPGLFDVDKRNPRYTRMLLDILGLSTDATPTVLITGSKGKGSTSALVASLQQEAGMKTGLFTGPHLVDFLERIRVDGDKIPEEDFVRLVGWLRPAADSLVAKLPPAHYLGPVGLVLVVALAWYRDKMTDFNVVECGRGALADDTNILWNRWSVLTPVMLEHRDNLGPSLLDIAANKLAVVKPGQQVCVSAAQVAEVSHLAQSLCQRFGVPLKLCGRDYRYEVEEWGLWGCRFNYRSQRRQSSFQVPLAGRFQAGNAAAAIALVEEIDPGRDDALIQSGLDKVKWPGRCELVEGMPPFILDGAINRQSAQHLSHLLEVAQRPLQIILAVPSDKDWQGVISQLAPLAENIWLTEASNPHLEFPPSDEVLSHARVYNRNSAYVSTVDEAMLQAAEKVGQGTVVVAGTQSLIRDAKTVLQSRFGRGQDL